MRLADRAYAQIVQWITQEQLQIGERLPSEAALAARFAVSRSVIREALVRLEADGLTQARRGAGSFVTRRPSALLAHHLPMEGLAAAMGSYELRFVVEAEAARLAALRRSAGEMEVLRARLEDLRRALHSGAAADHEDMALHRAIMVATGNQTFVACFDGLHEQIGQIMKAGVAISRARPPEAIAAMLGEHEDVVEAIGLRDGERAALAMHWHLSQGRRRLMP